jgi:hypothetical protein
VGFTHIHPLEIRMPSPGSLRRILTTTALAGAIAGLVLLPINGAYAGVAARYVASGSSDSFYTGSTVGATCDLEAGDNDNPVTTERDFSDGTKRASIGLNTHYVNSVDSSDSVHVKGHIDTKLTVDKRHRDLHSFDFAAGGNLVLTHSTTGSDCETSGNVVGQALVKFTEHKKGYFYFTRDTSKPHSVVVFVLENLKTQKVVALDAFSGTQSHATSRAFLKPGTYAIIQMQAGLTVSDSGVVLKSPSSTRQSVNLSMSLHGEFKPKR